MLEAGSSVSEELVVDPKGFATTKLTKKDPVYSNGATGIYGPIGSVITQL